MRLGAVVRTSMEISAFADENHEDEAGTFGRQHAPTPSLLTGKIIPLGALLHPGLLPVPPPLFPFTPPEHVFLPPPSSGWTAAEQTRRRARHERSEAGRYFLNVHRSRRSPTTAAGAARENVPTDRRRVGDVDVNHLRARAR